MASTSGGGATGVVVVDANGSATVLPVSVSSVDDKDAVGGMGEPGGGGDVERLCGLPAIDERSSRAWRGGDCDDEEEDAWQRKARRSVCESIARSCICKAAIRLLSAHHRCDVRGGSRNKFRRVFRMDDCA